MRLVISSLVVGALTLGSAGLLMAQHGGGAGHGSSGHVAEHSNFSRGAVPPTLPAPIGLQNLGSSGYTGINPGALRSNGGNHLVSRRRSYIAGGYLYAPYYPYSDFSSYPNDYGYGYGPSDDVTAQSSDATANLLGEQIQRLAAEVEDLRAQQQGMPPVPYAPTSSAQKEPDAAADPITVVLNNGQEMKVQSYAVMDGTFWDFSKQPAHRIPISSINVAASTKATESAGGEFPQL